MGQCSRDQGVDKHPDDRSNTHPRSNFSAVHVSTNDPEEILSITEINSRMVVSYRRCI